MNGGRGEGKEDGKGVRGGGGGQRREMSVMTSKMSKTGFQAYLLERCSDMTSCVDVRNRVYRTSDLYDNWHSGHKACRSKCHAHT